jgi:hypothetical protein
MNYTLHAGIWQLRAYETRSLAEQVVDPEAQRVFLEIAKRCERVAKLAELVQAVVQPRL